MGKRIKIFRTKGGRSAKNCSVIFLILYAYHQIFKLKMVSNEMFIYFKILLINAFFCLQSTSNKPSLSSSLSGRRAENGNNAAASAAARGSSMPSGRPSSSGSVGAAASGASGEWLGRPSVQRSNPIDIPAPGHVLSERALARANNRARPGRRIIYESETDDSDVEIVATDEPEEAGHDNEIPETPPRTPELQQVAVREASPAIPVLVVREASPAIPVLVEEEHLPPVQPRERPDGMLAVPFRKTTDMVRGVYSVRHMRHLHTPYGLRVAVSTPTHNYILPRRFVGELSSTPKRKNSSF